MFRGLSAFPLTPLSGDDIDTRAFAALVERLAASGVDSMGILGSTGSYAYLEKAERKRVLREALAHAGGVPVIVGVGALRSRDVLELARDAEDAGAAGLLLAPVSYQPLKEHEVYTLFESVSMAVHTPICVYDNPGTTRFQFSDELHGRIAALPNIGSVKIPPSPTIRSKPRQGSQRCAPTFLRTSRWGSVVTPPPCADWPQAVMAGTR